MIMQKKYLVRRMVQRMWKPSFGASISTNLKTTEMHSDSLHKFYNFENFEKGAVIVSQILIRTLKNKKIEKTDDIATAWQIIEFARKYEIDYLRNYNFNFYLINGKIKIKVGYDLKQIKEKIKEYEEYLRQMWKPSFGDIRNTENILLIKTGVKKHQILFTLKKRISKSLIYKKLY